MSAPQNIFKLETFTVEQFRGLRDLQLKGLSRINLFVGSNNSGKSSLLEAIACYCNPLEGFFWLETALRRSGRTFRSSRIEALKWLFPQFHNSTPLRLSESAFTSLRASGEFPIIASRAELGEVEAIRPRRGGRPRQIGETSVESLSASGDMETVRGAELRLSIETSNHFQSTEPQTLHRQLTVWDDQALIRRHPRSAIQLPVASVIASQLLGGNISAETFSNFRKLGLYEEAIGILRQLDDGVREILVLSERGGFGQLYIDHAVSGLTPLSSMGDGLRRALQIAILIPTVKDGILLVDEIESALHVSALTKVFELLINNCKAFNVQLFATTHSLEALDAILGTTLKNTDPELVLFRLETKAQKTSAVRLDEKMLSNLRNELGQEVR